MTPETRAQYKADIARSRHERDTYKKRAAQRWGDYLDLRRRKRWLEAIAALDRHHEYKRTATQYANDIKRLQQMSGLR